MRRCGSATQLAALDAWIEDQPEKPTRPEAVRAILREKLR